MKTSNYPNWLVPIEQAKRLKEIGFDLPCAFVLTNKDKIGFTTKGGNQYHLFEELDLNSNSKGSLVYVPTFEQVFEWFREKGLFHSICITDDLPHNVKFFEAEIRNNKADIICILSRLTYEEARKALIDKLIEIYENK